MIKSLGDRMKENYENITRSYLMKRTPVIIRVDGRAFHSYTRRMDRPFDGRFRSAMVYGAREVMIQMQGCKLAYVQSDEASFLLTDFDTLQTEAWFAYNCNKLVSVSASIMTAEFNSRIKEIFATDHEEIIGDKLATFDSRAFNIPKEEVSNYFLWRAQDWVRNSLLMYARSFFSHKTLMNKNAGNIHNMLHSIGKNWAIDLSDDEKNGVFIIQSDDKLEYVNDIEPSYFAIDRLTKRYLKENDNG
jgi:tRNA(His) 5'-end guanylyltransferase